MRLSIGILLFLILFNLWGGLMQEYDIDDQLGINAETGDPEELEQARKSAQSVDIGSGGVLQSIVGAVDSGLGALGDMFVGLQPGVQMLTNIIPSGIASALIVWVFSIVEIIVAIDILNYARGLA